MQNAEQSLKEEKKMNEKTVDTDAQAKVKAKLDELKLKRGGKIPKDAHVEGVPTAPQRPNTEDFDKLIKNVVEQIKEVKLYPDQIYHLASELQLVAVNDMIINGLQNFGVNVEAFMRDKFVAREQPETQPETPTQ